MSYDPTAFAALVGKVLEELEDGTWELMADRHGRTYLHRPDLAGSCLALRLCKGRVVARGLCPEAWDVSVLDVPQITVDPQRGPTVIAREIERRLLPSYLATLQQASQRQAEYAAHVEAVQRQTAELATLLGEPLNEDWGRAQPRLHHYRRTADGDLAMVKICGGRSRHRLELSLPHEEALAVVARLVEMWAAR